MNINGTSNLYHIAVTIIYISISEISHTSRFNKLLHELIVEV